jgi:hypothetical protein
MILYDTGFPIYNRLALIRNVMVKYSEIPEIVLAEVRIKHSELAVTAILEKAKGFEKLILNLMQQIL